MADVRSAAESVFRQESGRIIAGLIRISGSFDRAEEALQDAFASALASLRSERVVFAWSVGDGIALGAARLFWPDLPIPRPRQVEPLPFGFGKYAENWSREAGSQ